MLRTVTGDVPNHQRKILVHEHLQIDLSACKGPAVVLDWSNIDEVVADLEFAVERYDLGAVIDVTVESAGRRLEVLKSISEKTRVYVVGATGFHWDLYSDAEKRAGVEELRKHMVTELTLGAGGEGVCCGVIKVGTGSRPLTAMDEKMFDAAGLASRDTGAAVITHTSRREQAIWQLDRLESAGADLASVLIGHIDKYDEGVELGCEIGRRGAFVGIDQIGFNEKRPDQERAELVKGLCDHGLEGAIILSSDISGAGKLRGNGGTGYSTVFERFLPLCMRNGVGEDQLSRITCNNPQRLLQVPM